MTTASSILSIFFLPLNLILYSNLAFGENSAKQIKWFEFGVSIAVVISAMFCGLWVAYKFEKAIEEEEKEVRNDISQQRGAKRIVSHYEHIITTNSELRDSARRLQNPNHTDLVVDVVTPGTTPSTSPTTVDLQNHKNSTAHHSSLEIEQGEVSEDEKDDRVATVVPVLERAKEKLTGNEERITVIELASRFRG